MYVRGVSEVRRSDGLLLYRLHSAHPRAWVEFPTTFCFATIKLLLLL